MKQHTSILSIILGLMITLSAEGQQLPLQNHYFINPYVYNPALAGYENHAIGYINRRQQFNSEAPSRTSFTFNTPVASSGGFGLSFFNTSYDTASSSLAYASFARVIPLTEDQFFRFGVSAGFGFDQLDLKSITNPSIPGLQSAEERKAHFQAQIGLHYQWQALQLGLSLPSMFDPEPIDIENPDNFSGLDFDPFRGVMISAGYMLAINEMLELQPQALYRLTRDAQNQFEVGMLAHIQKQFWLGGSYRQDYGAVAMAGIRFRDLVSFGYALEFSGSQDLSPQNSNHEFQLGIRFGTTRPPVKKGFRIVKEKPEGARKPRYYYQPKRTGRSQ